MDEEDVSSSGPCERCPLSTFTPHHFLRLLMESTAPGPQRLAEDIERSLLISLVSRSHYTHNFCGVDEHLHSYCTALASWSEKSHPEVLFITIYLDLNLLLYVCVCVDQNCSALQSTQKTANTLSVGNFKARCSLRILLYLSIWFSTT